MEFDGGVAPCFVLHKRAWMECEWVETTHGAEYC